mgnify:CR=1 FL=1|jgi:hypothetical protein
MKIKDLLKELKGLPLDAEIKLGSDEELNTLYNKIEVAKVQDIDENDKDIEYYSIYGYDIFGL